MKRYMICLLVCMTFLIVPINASEELNTLDSVEELLDQYDREGAYYELLEIYETLEYEDNPDLYLEVLSLLISIEDYYWFIGDLTVHSIELYELSMESENYEYMMQGLDGLYSIDYYNYDNNKAFNKLSEILAIEDSFGDGNFLIHYNIGRAMLLLDESDYEGARSFLQQALRFIDKTPFIPDIRLPIESEIYTLFANSYEYEGDFEKAQEYMLMAREAIDEKDIEVLIDANINYVYYTLYNGDYDLATKTYSKIKEDYYLASESYQSVVTPSSIDILGAEIAFASGDYTTAAFLYHSIYNEETEDTFLEDNIKSQNAMNDFEQRVVDKELLVYQQLKKSQTKVIETYQMGLVILSVLLLIIGFVVHILFIQRKKLKKLSTTDILTGINNRRHIMEVFDDLEIGSYYIGLLDLDHFKLINDTYGHHVGDEVLVKVAKVLESKLGDKHYVGRYGGEEFVLILNTSSEVEAKRIVRSLMMSIRSIKWSADNHVITASVGLAYSKTLDAEKVLNVADEQLYISKNNGRDRYTYKAV